MPSRGTASRPLGEGTETAAELVRGSRRSSKMDLIQSAHLPTALAFGSGVIMPSSTSKHYWDAFILTAVMYTSLLIPIEVAFDEDFGLGVFILSILIDGAFVFDIVLSFRTAYLDEWGNLVVSASKIRRNYLQGWFVLDLAASVPVDLVLIVATHLHDGSRKDTVLNWLGVLKIYRLLRFGRILKVLKNMKHANAFRILRLLFGYLLMAHLVGCAWYMLNRLEDDEQTWITEVVGDTNEVSLRTKYFKSFYSAMLMLIGETVDVHTAGEKAFSIFTNLIGAIITATIFGNVAALVSSIGANQAVCRQKLEAIVERMRFLEIPADIQEKIRNYYEYLFVTRGGMDDGIAFLNELSPNMRHDVNAFLHSDVLFKLGFLDSVRGTADFPNICDDIAASLQSRVYLPKDFIFQRGDIGLECFVIAKGTVLILSLDHQQARLEDGRDERGGAYHFLEAGHVFGEMALLDQSEGKVHRRTHAAHAETFCDLFVLEKQVVETVAARYPDFQDGWTNWLTDRKVSILLKTISTWLGGGKSPQAVLSRFVYRWRRRRERRLRGQLNGTLGASTGQGNAAEGCATLLAAPGESSGPEDGEANGRVGGSGGGGGGEGGGGGPRCLADGKRPISVDGESGTTLQASASIRCVNRETFNMQNDIVRLKRKAARLELVLQGLKDRVWDVDEAPS